MNGWRLLATIALVGLPSLVLGQDKTYGDYVRQAEAAYASKDYTASGHLYSKAFEVQKWMGTPNDRYNAACAWALAAGPDSAFFQLFRIAGVPAGVGFYEHMLEDSDLVSLHPDKRWKDLCDLFKTTKEKVEAGLNKPLAARLDSIFSDDQGSRMKVGEYLKKYGPDSKEFQGLARTMRDQDSVDVIKVTKILDQYGWLGPEVVGEKGNAALFLVIQHADPPIQDKYLPMMREAVKTGKAGASQLALLEDRVNLHHGKRQIYGSQIGTDSSTGRYYVLPLEDPDHVDQRRAEVGLGPLNEYVSHWNIAWDAEQYKKDLPEIEARAKKP